MTMPAGDASARSRQHVAAGLVVRLVDHVLSRPADRRGVLCVIAIGGGDVAEVGRRIAEARDWPVIPAVEKVSPTGCLRRLARALAADPTGNQTYLCRQLHDAFNDRPAAAVAVVAGLAALRPCLNSFELLAGHRNFVLVVVTDSSTANHFRRRASHRIRWYFMVVTPAEREHVGRVLVRLTRLKRRAWAART